MCDTLGMTQTNTHCKGYVVPGKGKPAGVLWEGIDCRWMVHGMQLF